MTSVWYTYKPVASTLAGLSVRDDHRFLDLAIHLEVLTERLVRGVVGQASDEDLGEGGVLLVYALRL